MDDKHLFYFGECKTRLLAIAYRMLGTFHEAEDVLQEVYLQWQEIDLNSVESPEAFLKTLTIRRATDLLRKASRLREEYVGPWLPGPFVSEEEKEQAYNYCPERKREITDNLSIAFMMLLEQLTPPERAVFIMRTGFDYSYEEIAEDLSLSVAHCRQLFSRANKNLSLKKRNFKQDMDAHREMLSSFQQAIETEDTKAFSKLLSDEVILYSDGGGKSISALLPIFGKPKVTRLMAGLAKKWKRLSPNFTLSDINGDAGLLWRDGSSLQTVVSLCSEDGKIREIYLMRNPDKIKHLN